MKFYFLYFVMFFTGVSYAQFGAQQLISDTSLGSRAVQTADLDGDGDLDVLSSSSFDDMVSWYENTDGLGSFGEKQIIGTLNSTNSSFPSDLDGDGDFDVIATSSADDKLVIYFNEDGQGNFGNEIILANDNQIFDAKAFDLDNDTDNDIVFISFAGGKLQWIENIDGQGNFGAPQLISNNTPVGTNVQGDDIDGDGDIDIVAAIAQIDTVAWYENTDGLGAFSSANIITTNADGVISVSIADMDGDDDLDVVSTSFLNDSSDVNLFWYENTDGLGAFMEQHIISENFNSSYFVSAIDVDNDGDTDILSNTTELGNGQIFWQENLDGLGNFGPQISFGENIEFCRYIIGADIDNDGDNDVVYSDQNAGVVAWHENLTILGINDFQNTLPFTVHPNPANNNIILTSDVFLKDITVYTILGVPVITTQMQEIDVTKLAAGNYVVKVVSEEGYTGYQVFIKG